MKNATRYCAGPAYYRMCSTDVYCSKQTGSSSTKVCHHFFVSGIGQKKTVDAAKICGGAENVVKTETQQTFVNGLLSFIPKQASLRWKRVCIAHNNCMIYIDMGNIYPLYADCFCIVIGLSLRVNNPIQRCLPVGRLHYPRRRRWWLHALTDRLLMCNRRPAATSSRRASFSALASANSFVYFASGAATSR